MPEISRRLTTILAADVAGYSRLAEADEEGTVSRLRALRHELIDPAISAHRGRVVNTAGDSLLIEFASVVDTVRCAIDVQRSMSIRNADFMPEKRIEFRVGIHLGDVMVESDGDLMGDGVNIAARLQGIAKPGGICLSSSAFECIQGKVDVAVADLGEHNLKNIAKPVRVYALDVGKPAQAKPTKRAAAKQRSILLLLGAGIVALIVIAGGAWYFQNRPAAVATNAPTPSAAAAPLSVVVLPFTNLSGDPSQDYFADGITDNLTTDLSRIRNSFVIARNTAFTYKGKSIDAKEIGKELGVRYVLEGSVQRDQDRVRVNAQLIDADRGAHLWADHFDTARADLLQIQDEIVARLAYALGFELLEAETQRNTLSANSDADDLAMRCTTAVRKAGYFGKEADAGYRLCEQALDADPNNVRALTTLAAKFYLPVMLNRTADPRASLKRADELASRALAVDANSGVAHYAKGQVLRAAPGTQGAERRFDDAIAEYERALALDPNDANTFAALSSTYFWLRQPEKAIEFMDKAIRLSPHDPALFFWYFMKSWAYLALQQYDQAIEWTRRSIAINPNYPLSYGVIATAFALTGHEAEARDAWRRQRDLEHLDGANLGGTAQAPDKGTERPDVKVGDRWVFVKRSTAGAKLEYAWVVTSVSPTGIAGTENGQPLALTLDLNIIESPQEKNSDDRFLSFPLAVGKHWSYVNDYVLNDMTLGTLQGHNNESVAVLGYEKVRVPAGEFDAFKLELHCKWASPQAPFPGVCDNTYWYAPAVRAIVKKVRQSTGMAIYTTELVEFQLQP